MNLALGRKPKEEENFLRSSWVRLVCCSCALINNLMSHVHVMNWLQMRQDCNPMPMRQCQFRATRLPLDERRSHALSRRSRTVVIAVQCLRQMAFTSHQYNAAVNWTPDRARQRIICSSARQPGHRLQYLIHVIKRIVGHL